MVEEISPDELHARLQDGEAVDVVDVRPEADYRAGHVPGAENVPLSRFARAVADREWDDYVVLVCPIGESSIQAGRLLEAYEGVAPDARVASLAGGYAAWEYDLERE